MQFPDQEQYKTNILALYLLYTCFRPTRQETEVSEVHFPNFETIPLNRKSGNWRDSLGKFGNVGTFTKVSFYMSMS